MLIFGHIGLTIAIIYTFQRIRFPRLVLDYRLVILGSLLPDIIDKPIGYIIFQKYYENGWIYGHTLLFSLVLLIFSYSIATKYLILGFSTLLHLIEDRVIIYMPRTFFWPLLGWNFSKNGEFTSKWIEYTISSLYTNQYIQLTEVAGLTVISYLILRHKLYIKSNLITFIKTGKLIDK
jgi:inner membrane protein